MEAFSSKGYEDVSVDDLANRAGISRGLLYHYFPSKRDFFIAVTEAAAAEVRELTRPDTSLAPAARLAAAVDAFLAYAEAHPQGFLTTYRGSVAGDPAIRNVVARARRRQGRRIVEVIAPGRAASPLLGLAVEGWLSFAQEVTASWLQKPSLPRSRVRDMLIRVLLCAADLHSLATP